MYSCLREDGDGCLEQFRSYLQHLAESRLDRRFSRRMSPSDLVQETFLRAWQALRDFQGGCDAQLAAWLRQILGRSIEDAVRDLKRLKRDYRRELSLEQACMRSSLLYEGFLQSALPSPSSQYERGERRLRMEKALSGLPDGQRKAIVLRHCFGWSLPEIQAELGRTRAGVAGLLRRGLRRLRAELEGWD